MAQDRQNGPASRGRRRLGRGLAAMALSSAVVVSGLVAGQGRAAATPDTVSEAKANLASIEAQTSKIEANYTTAQAKLDQASKSLASANKDLKTQRAKVAQMRSTLSTLAVNDYQSGGVSLTAQLVTSGDSTQFLSKLATVQNVSDRTKSQFLDFQSQQARLQTLEKTAATDQAAIKSSRDSQATLLKQAKAKQGEAQEVLNRLTAQERERLAREQAAEAAAAAARAAAVTSRSEARTSTTNDSSAATSSRPSSSPSASESASRTSTSTSNRSATSGTDSSASDGSGSSSSASGRAATAIAFALSKVGGPYVYGGTGPTGYDCSGLMQAAWAAAGVSLPRTSEDQFNVGTAVSTSDLQPGDLVFYYGDPPSHVAMYIGNGRIVHAANPNSGIKVASVGEMPISGARRVG